MQFLILCRVMLHLVLIQSIIGIAGLSLLQEESESGDTGDSDNAPDDTCQGHRYVKSFYERRSVPREISNEHLVRTSSNRTSVAL